jgi:hypothetical protein
MLATSSAAPLRRVQKRRHCLFFREPRAVHEHQEVRLGLIQGQQSVAELADARIAAYAEPAPEQLRRFTVVQVQLPGAGAALAGRGVRTGLLVAQALFPYSLALT